MKKRPSEDKSMRIIPSRETLLERFFIPELRERGLVPELRKRGIKKFRRERLAKVF